jgi:hypothetical protein
MAKELSRTVGSEEIIALVVRDRWFTNSNEILSDMHRLFEQAKGQLMQIAPRRPTRLSILVLVKDDLTLPQVASPIQLPNWFPVRPGLETFFYITDLLGVDCGGLLNSPELMIDRIAALTYALEEALVGLLEQSVERQESSVRSFLERLMMTQGVHAKLRIVQYRKHLSTVVDPRAYRPNAASKTNSLVSDFLKRVLDSSPPALAEHANALGNQLALGREKLKPSHFGVSMRPKSKMTTSGANWHSIVWALYQAYQMMNAAAHAGDYGRYPVGLLHYSSADLQIFLQSSCECVLRSTSNA